MKVTQWLMPILAVLGVATIPVDAQSGGPRVLRNELIEDARQLATVVETVHPDPVWARQLVFR